MKKLKLILALLVATTFSNCGDDTTVSFTLSAENIAGAYDITSINAEEEETATSSSGSVVNVSTTTIVGDSFDDINFIINTNGSYTAVGKYRVVITETPNGGSPVSENQIIVFDAAGSYQLDTMNNTITFSQQSGDFIEGTFNITSFNETSFLIGQEDVNVDGGITYTFKGEIKLVRK